MKQPFLVIPLWSQLKSPVKMEKAAIPSNIHSCDLGKAVADYKPVSRLLLITFLSLFLIILLRNACLVDDAYIGLRTVDNFVNGCGLTWNAIERVQTYTCPLWILLLSAVYFFTHEAFFTTIFISVAASLLAIVFVFRSARSTSHAILCSTILLFSKAFMDFSAAGLENPLTHLLVAWFLFAYFQPRGLLLLSTIAALAVTNRMETILICAPCLAYAFWQARSWNAVGCLAVGFLPFLLWEFFAVWYYGFPLPNTFYAKLGTGIDRWISITQGWFYLANSFRRDPLTLWSIAIGAAVPFLTRDRRLVPVSPGIFLTIAYVVWAGGDFMSGRFLTTPLLAAVMTLGRCRIDLTNMRFGLALATVAIVGFMCPYPPILSGANYGLDRASVALEERTDHGIADERSYYYPFSGFLNGGEIKHRWAAQGRAARNKALVIQGNIGFFGFYAGPGVYIVDAGALTDPLLAHLPAVQFPGWRAGHFTRKIPAGYIATLLSGRNRIADKDLATYWDKLALVTRGSLCDWNRLLEIWRLNTGQYRDLIDAERYRDGSPLKLRLSEIPQTQADTDDIHFTQAGIEIDLEGRPISSRLEIGIPNEHHYALCYLRGDEVLGRQTVRPTREASSVGMAVYYLDVPKAAVISKKIRIMPIPGFHDGCCRLGHLKFHE